MGIDAIHVRLSIRLVGSGVHTVFRAKTKSAARAAFKALLAPKPAP
jgi:hypothetical protein